MFSRKGPTRESMNKVTFTFTLVGRGWKNKISEPNVQHSTAPDSTIVLQVLEFVCNVNQRQFYNICIIVLQGQRQKSRIWSNLHNISSVSADNSKRG